MGGHLHAGQRRYHVSRREIVELNVAGEPNSRPGGSDCRLVREPDPRLLTDSTRLMTSRRLRAEAIVVSLPGAAMMRGGASDGCFFLVGCFRLVRGSNLDGMPHVLVELLGADGSHPPLQFNFTMMEL